MVDTPHRIYLDEHEMPTTWYNVIPDDAYRVHPSPSEITESTVVARRSS